MMKARKTSLKGVLLLGACSLFFCNSRAQKNAGIFYSTLYAKQAPVKRIENFGDGADYFFLKDVNGDGKDDAVAIYTHGEKKGGVYVALSGGSLLLKPVCALTFMFQWDFIHPLMGDLNGDGKADMLYLDQSMGAAYAAFSRGASFQKPVLWPLPQPGGPFSACFLADVNGDKKADLLYYCASGKNKGKWFAAISTGTRLEVPYLLSSGFGADATQRLVGDANGDGYTDLIAFYQQTGTWKVALSDGRRCITSSAWAQGFPAVTQGNDRQAMSKPVCMAYDVDKDGKDDIVVWNKGGDCSWRVAYASSGKFTGNQLWLANFLHSEHKNNVTAPEWGGMGTLDGDHAMAMVASRGKWLGVTHVDKINTADLVTMDTWEAWGCDYIPDGGTYDSGDPATNDRQIKQIHDAGFTYVTMDVTNGSNAWVDDRVKRFMERVRYWNEHLKPGDHKMYVNISLGLTRGIKGEDAFFNALNQECKRAWEEFYVPFKDLYYMLDDKPLVIHMITTGWEYVQDIGNWKGNRTYLDKITSRWMDGTQSGASGDKANCYGWIVPGKFGNVRAREMMPVMPGFWNGLTFFDREDGDMYRSQWMRVIQYQPQSVWVNSFNETWEHTSVEPSYHVIDQFVANPLFTKPWSDYYGNRMDDFYWRMTKEYNQLYMHGDLYEGTYFQEYGDSTIFKAVSSGFVRQAALPVMAPVLLLPEGFRKHFKGHVVKN